MEREILRASAILLLVVGSAVFGHAENRKCENGLTDTNLRIRSWAVETRWGTAAALSPDLTSDPMYSLEKVSKAVAEVRAALLPQVFSDFAKGGVSVLFVESCVVRTDAENVEVIISPHLVQVDLINVGSNVLPVPHFNRPAAPAYVAPPASKLDPRVSLENDRKDGVSQTVSFRTDVMKSNATIEPTTSVNKLVLGGTGSKALNKRFYDGVAEATFARERRASTLREISFDSSFEGERSPLGAQDLLQNTARAGFLLSFVPRTTAMRRAVVGGGYRRSTVNIQSQTSAGQHSSENGFEFRAVTDWRIFSGIARAAGWVDGGTLIGSTNSYQRTAFSTGYAVNVPFPGTAQTFGIEALFGTGNAWGGVPQYRRFFAGNDGAGFLYEKLTSPKFAQMPVGPLLRSYGKAQVEAGRGAYWNLNLNVSIPIPNWSRPLVPAVDTPIGALPELIKSQAVTSGKSFLASYYETNGLTSQEAAKRADADMREVAPAVNYLADFAKLYAVKPLFLYDAARVNALTRQAIGGGMQLTIVVAHFQAGYLATVSPLANESRGNFIVRMVFENLF